MPASDVPTLFDYESAYENALAAYFANLNGAPFSQVLTPRTNVQSEDRLETPRLTLAMSITGTGDKEDFNPAGANYYSHKLGSLSIVVATQRSNASQPHGTLRGRVRQAMLELTDALNANNLPNYQTVFVTESSASQAVDADNDEILTQFAYAVEFYIPPSSWPNS